MIASTFYRYANANPINRVDPTGYIDWPTCAIQGDYGNCTIWDGDTYYKIGREIIAAGVSADLSQIIAEIIALNPQNPNPNYIQIGDSLTLRAEWIRAIVSGQSASPPQPSVPPLPPYMPSPGLVPWGSAIGILYELGGVNDLEAMVRISELYAILSRATLFKQPKARINEQMSTKKRGPFGPLEIR